MNVAKDAPGRPALRYMGGKWILAPWIIGYFPHHRVYVEPFGGAASVLLRKPRAYAEIYNDMDGEIVNFFRVLRDPASARELTRLVELTPFARSEFETAYLSNGDPIEQARRTLIKSFMGFGSDGISARFGTGFRSNSNRSGTTPAHDWAHFPKTISELCRRLRGVVIENAPAHEIIERHDSPKTLHYIDPPYPHSTRSRIRSHPYRFEMDDSQHRELSGLLHSLKGMVVVSGYACELYDNELYPDWKRIERQAYADGARERTEILWISPRTWSMLQSGAGLPLFQSATKDK